MAANDPFAVALMHRYAEGDVPAHMRRSHETIGEANKRKRGVDAVGSSQSKTSKGDTDDVFGDIREETDYVRLQFNAPRVRNQITNQVCEQYIEKIDVILYVMPYTLPCIVATQVFAPSTMSLLITINRHTSPFTTMITTSEIHSNNKYVVRRFDRYAGTASLGSIAAITTTPLLHLLQHVNLASSIFSKTRQNRVLVFASPASSVRPCDLLIHTIAAVYELISRPTTKAGMINIAIDQSATALVAYATGSNHEKEAAIASLQLAEAIHQRVMPRLSDGDMATPVGIQTIQARRQVSEISAALGTILTDSEPAWFCFMSQPVPKLPLDGLAIVTLEDYVDTGNVY